jgi:acetyl esterase
LAHPATELDPQVTALLAQFQAMAAQQPAPDPNLSLAEQIAARHRAFRAIGASFSTAFEPVARAEDRRIPGPAGDIPVRLYAPLPQAPTPAPVLVFYHGGGFCAGDLESHDRPLRALANRSGCLLLAVDYRLAPDHPYPAANDDCWAALVWVAEHAAAIGADPTRIAVGGDSAGGLLAAWVAQKARTHGPALRLQVLLYPNLDATTALPSWKQFGTGQYLVSHVKMREWFDLYLPKGIHREDPAVSPLFATDLSGLAPAFLVTADHDPLHDEGEAYAARLKAAHVPLDYTCWPGMIHGFFHLAGALDAGKVLTDQTAAALRKAFELPAHS